MQYLDSKKTQEEKAWRELHGDGICCLEILEAAHQKQQVYRNVVYNTYTYADIYTHTDSVVSDTSGLLIS